MLMYQFITHLPVVVHYYKDDELLCNNSASELMSFPGLPKRQRELTFYKVVLQDSTTAKK